MGPIKFPCQLILLGKRPVIEPVYLDFYVKT